MPETAPTEPEVIEGDNGVTLTLKPSDVGWVLTATETETDETLLQWTFVDLEDARRVRENALGSDISDMR